ncbi:MAG: sulfatase-like hydrolase/transferase, partial [Methylocella sp.]
PATPAPRHANLFAGAKAPRPPSFDEADVSDKPAWNRSKPELNSAAIQKMDELYRKRLQSLHAVDELVASIVQTLETTGQLDNTYIFFSSDNGFHLGEHRLVSGKNTAFETDLRVPMMARGPAIAAGTKIQELGVNIDFAPTFAELAGVTPPAEVDGRSLVPPLKGGAADWRKAFLLEHAGPADESGDAGASLETGRQTANKELALLLEPPDDDLLLTGLGRLFGGGGGGPPVFKGIHTEDYVYVEYRDGERELYDMKADPNQLSNIYETADQGLVAKLSAWLAALSNCAGASCRAAENSAPSGKTRFH